MAYENFFTVGADYDIYWRNGVGVWANIEEVPYTLGTVEVTDDTLQIRVTDGVSSLGLMLTGAMVVPQGPATVTSLQFTASNVDIANLGGALLTLSVGVLRPDGTLGSTVPLVEALATPFDTSDLTDNPAIAPYEGAVGTPTGGTPLRGIGIIIERSAPEGPYTYTSIDLELGVQDYTAGGGGGGGGLCADITGFNCTPYPDNDNLTLAEYRAKLLIRAGFAAVASNPPPGTAALFNSFLQDAQDFLYKKYPALETRWIFRWSLEEGVRYYGIRDNDGLEGDCSIFMDPYKNIEGAWLVDLNGQWLPMAFGIPPAFYTTVNNPALPFRLEIRQCVEIFPAPPADGYLLMIKGHFGKQPFTEDDDKPTIDGQLVYLWALANALDYYGKPSAAGIATQANDYLGQLVAGTHTGKRYIPGTRPANPAIVPVYAPWPGEY